MSKSLYPAIFHLINRVSKQYQPGIPLATSEGSILHMEYPGWKMSKTTVGILHIKVATNSAAVLVVEQDDDDYTESMSIDYSFSETNSNINRHNLLDLYDHLTDLIYWSMGGTHHVSQ